MNDEATAVLDGKPQSMGELIAWRVSLTPDVEAFRFRDADEQWTSLTWAQAGERINEVAAGLLALGVGIEERVAIASGTRWEWIIADYGINAAGGATTTVYPNTSPDDFLHIVGHSASKVLIAENAAQAAKLDGADPGSHSVEYVVVFDGPGDGDKVLSWEELVSRGKARLAEQPDCVQKATAATSRDSLATLIYTSGTTGLPKGVELTHQNWIYEGFAVDQLGIIRPDDLQYLWLPLSHVFGKCLLAIQLAIGFTSAVDGRLDKIVAGLGETKPTFMCGAPRIYEKVRSAVLTANSSGVKGAIAGWAFAVGKETEPYRLEGKELPRLLKVKHAIADKLVFSKLRHRLGGRIRFMVSGSVKLNRQVQGWFYSAGLLIIEGYGLTETTAVSFVNVPTQPRLGTVGPAAPGTEVRIADDGEVLLRGPGVMRGYHHAAEQTAESIVDGWFHTGDIGHLDADGFLTLTDRKKDLMKTSGGKYVAPQKVEGALVAAIPFIGQVVAIGDNRRYVSALITTDHDNVLAWAERNGLSGSSYADVTQSEALRTAVQEMVDKANATLERWETVKKFTILDQEFTVDAGQVTPSMKLRRAAITKHYADVVNKMYGDDSSDQG